MQEEIKSTKDQKKKEKSSKKKKKNGVLAGFGKVIRIFMATFTIIIAIAAASTVLYYLYTSYEKGPTPDQLVKEYFTLLSESKYDQMYDYLSDESKANISRQDYITRHKNIYTGIKTANLTSNITEIEEKINARIVTFDTSMDTIAGNITFTNRLIVKKNSDNVYKIDWDDHLIFPSLTADAKVQRFDYEPVRGDIYDRNHNAIAIWGKCFQVGIQKSNLIQGEDQDIDESIKELSKLLDMDIDEMNQIMETQYVDDETPIIFKKISDKEKEKMNGKLMKVPGVYVEDEEVRFYPYGEKMCHLSGYINSISAEELAASDPNEYDLHSVIGKTGLEKVYESRLKGKRGYEIAIVDANDKKLDVLASMPVENGEDIEVTIDADLQILLYDQFKDDNAAVVSVDPLTGEVLAMVSTPAYDPNIFPMHTITDAELKELTDDEDKPFLNRFASSWAPGSTFKPITAGIGVTSGDIDPSKTEASNGLKWQKDDSWGNHYVTTLQQYGTVNLKNALIYSDNIYFAKAALDIGTEGFTSGLESVGFNETLPFDFEMSMSSFGQEGITSEAQLADSGYGQGEMLVNPLHLSMMYTALVNDGDMLEPTLEYTEEPRAKYWKEDVFSTDAVYEVEEDIVQVVEKGTGKAARVSGLTIGGKTGTAEIKASQDDKEGTELGWFVGVTTDPESEKQLLVTAMVENVKGRGGSSYVTPKVRPAFQALANQKN